MKKYGKVIQRQVEDPLGVGAWTQETLEDVGVEQDTAHGLSRGLVKGLAKRKALGVGTQVVARGLSRYGVKTGSKWVPGVGEVLMAKDAAPVALEGVKRTGKKAIRSAKESYGHVRKGQIKEAAKSAARGYVATSVEGAKAVGRTGIAAFSARELGELTYTKEEREDLARRREERKKRKARANSDIPDYAFNAEFRRVTRVPRGYVIEHQKRGQITPIFESAEDAQAVLAHLVAPPPASVPLDALIPRGYRTAPSRALAMIGRVAERRASLAFSRGAQSEAAQIEQTYNDLLARVLDAMSVIGQPMDAQQYESKLITFILQKMNVPRLPVKQLRQYAIAYFESVLPELEQRASEAFSRDEFGEEPAENEIVGDVESELESEILQEEEPGPVHEPAPVDPVPSEPAPAPRSAMKLPPRKSNNNPMRRRVQGGSPPPAAPQPPHISEMYVPRVLSREDQQVRYYSGPIMPKGGPWIVGRVTNYGFRSENDAKQYIRRKIDKLEEENREVKRVIDALNVDNYAPIRFNLELTSAYGKRDRTEFGAPLMATIARVPKGSYSELDMLRLIDRANHDSLPYVRRLFERMLQRQTTTEREVGAALEKNLRGFSAADAQTARLLERELAEHDALKEMIPTRLRYRLAKLLQRYAVQCADIMNQGAKQHGFAIRTNPGAQDLVIYQQIMGTLRAIQWKSWTLHWQSGGANYYGDHLLLQRLYAGEGGGPDINASIDGLGERMVAYYGPQAVDPHVINVQADTALQTCEEQDGFRTLIRLEVRLQHLLRAAWQGNQNDKSNFSLGIDDFIMALADERDTAIYLLERRLS